ncbi:MAG: BamA/TamA family outer membrane protein [Lentimicrobium sp.]|jgi:outer membrane protein insertion porin family|nr:BamA/TamA family outer membrane protein [Lentimicrobium sp.]MDD2529360.1 POTRA domain-containing protein [Lentimicrobiaceae bacterium]MDD4598207.1 POTRA domain-containing protein [Lentimicrobiaceae bacterium]MDY0026225.1 POTRA domain-containing protein [Lentimicrobium sp.]HAH57610.1 outer membrane protein assembly factor BamA [Bacteroidales bacterium]
MKLYTRFPAFLLLLISFSLQAQIRVGDDLSDIDYARPRQYIIGGVTITGVQYLDHDVLIMLSGLQVADKIEIPGEKIRRAIEKLWEQGLFENVRISATKFSGELVFLNIELQERPRLERFSFKGIKKSEADDLREKIKLVKGDVVTENVINRTTNIIKKHYTGKGFLNAQVNITQSRDTIRPNQVSLIINIDKKNKVRIDAIHFYGNKEISDMTLKRTLKDTKERGIFKPFRALDQLIFKVPVKVLSFNPDTIFNALTSVGTNNFRIRIFKGSKFIRDDYNADLRKLISKYNDEGYRDATIVKDTVYRSGPKSIDIDIHISEGRRYYFGDIKWVGNTKYTAEQLNEVLKIKRGDVYNQSELEANLNYNPNEIDISTLYLDDGYLFFQVNPVEVRVVNDTIDLEMRIREGKQATINKVSVKGNTRTNDHVVMRELRTRPGQLFSRSDIIRTTRELAQLRYFDPEKIVPTPIPNPADGTVDIEYKVEETSADQIELSGGWGYGRIVGTLGLSFNNFSARNIFKGSAWRPVPTGDGQKLSLRLQSYGRGYISYSASFTEPWLGGKKPNSFSVSYFHSLYSNMGTLEREQIDRYFKIDGVQVMLGKRLAWPDDYFTLVQRVSLQMYRLKNYNTFSFGSGTGQYNNFSYGLTFARNSIDSPIFPRSGSEVSASLDLTPPYSLFSNKDYKSMPDEERFKWIEYHKWKFNFSLYRQIVGNLVLSARTKYGFLGAYNTDIGITPFDRFYLGGDGLSGYNNLDGREIIGMRGYTNESLTPDSYLGRNVSGGTIFNKTTLELRYPLSLNPSATIYVMGFVEAGNAWKDFKAFDPFTLKRTAGVGVRVFLPMFGLLGLDWGYGFDDIYGLPSANKGQFHFSINQSID